MKFTNLIFEISGIKEVRIDGELYTRQIGERITDGGKTIRNKYFRRESDGHMIHEHKFMKKMKNLQRESHLVKGNQYTYVDSFGNVKTDREDYWVNKWRFWFSGETINIERILV